MFSGRTPAIPEAPSDKLAQGGVAQIRGALVAELPKNVSSPAKAAGIAKWRGTRAALRT